MLDLGVLIETGGRAGAVVRFLPPLIIDPDQIDRIAAVFGEAVAAVGLDGPTSPIPDSLRANCST
jgi:4-aminobutyrate aminotransferase-like enzyme